MADMEYALSRAIKIIEDNIHGMSALEIEEIIKREFPEIDAEKLIKRIKKHPDIYQPRKDFFQA